MAGLATVMGAQLTCTSGSGTVELITDPTMLLIGGENAGTITDGVADVNIPAFEACDILRKCIPLTVAWAAGNPAILIDGIPILTEASVCPCLAAAVVAAATGGAGEVGPCLVMIVNPNNFSVFV